MSNPAIKFRAPLEQSGRTATGITVPEEILTALGGGRRPPVRVTLHDHTYESTVGSMDGVAKIPVSAAVREAAGVAAGDVLEVEVVLDTAPRTVAVPDDLAGALADSTDAAEFFASLTPSRRKACVTWVESAKRAETRQARVTRAVEMLAAGTPPR